MVLSDSEQRKLDEIERALAEEGAQKSQHSSVDLRRRHRTLVAVGALMTGIVVLLVGLVMTAVAILVGIVISVVGAGISGVAVVYLAGLYRGRVIPGNDG